MKTIYLQDSNWKWHTHEFESMDELRKIISDNNYSAKIGDSAEIGYSAKIGDSAEIGYSAKIGYSVKIGNSAKIGDYVEIGYSAKIGDSAELGYSAKIGDSAMIGDYAEIGYSAKIGNSAEIGDSAEIVSNPLYIIGSRNIICNYKDNEIQIGCMVKDFDYWLKNYERVGKAEGYTDVQITEYKSYIDLIVNKYKSITQSEAV